MNAFRTLLSSEDIDPDNIHEESEAEESEAFVAILLFVPLCLLLGNLTRYIHNELYIPVPYTVMLMVIGLCLGIGEFYTYETMGIVGEAVLGVKRMSPHLLLGVFIPPLIFESAFGLPISKISFCFVFEVFFKAPTFS